MFLLIRPACSTKNLESEIADTIYIQEMPNYEAEQLIMMVAKGDIDFAVCDAQVARINATLMPEIDIQTAISFTQMQSWAMRPSSTELQAKVDSFLIHFLETKAYRDIYRKYYK
jgi:membrane-bound lytic murein transglycosylase MltF